MLGLCIDEEIRPFLMRVSGDSGCDRYMPMKKDVARAAGSASAPPTAKATRYSTPLFYPAILPGDVLLYLPKQI